MIITRRKLTGFCVIGVLVVLVVYLFSNLQMNRRGAVRIASAFRMRQVIHALDAYDASHGKLPPRILVTATRQGPLRHSWRVALLPHLVSPEVASRYNLDKPWDDEANLKAAKEIDVFSISKGKSDAAYFAISDSSSDSLSSNASAVRIVSIPDKTILWSQPDDVTATEVWSAIVQDPELVLTDVQGGCVIPFGKIAKTEEECQGWLGVVPITADQRLEFHRRIVAATTIPEARKKCSKEILAKQK